MTAPRSITVHIEKLVITGLPVGRSDSSLLKAAVERKLEAMISETGLRVPHDRERGAVAGSPLLPPAGMRPAALGERIAESVYHGIAGTDRRQERASGTAPGNGV